MLIPLRTDRDPKRRPIVTEVLIIINLVVYLAGLIGETAGFFQRDALADWGALQRNGLQVWQLVSYQFLHDPHGIGHLAFNMLFLWVFGGPVEDRLGRAGFLGFYLIGGAVAGIAHTMIDPHPVIGASGSIACVTGAFLALFPRSTIRVLLFFFIIGIYHIPSLYFIGFFFLVDLLRQTSNILGGGGSEVAYMAHLAGYVYGFALAFTLLALRIVKREEFDVFFLFTQARRRVAFRAASRGVGAVGAWESAAADTGARLAQQQKKAKPISESDAKRLEERAEINRLAVAHDLRAAAQRYRALLKEAPDSVFGQDRQLELANQFYVEGDHVHAAAAYELFLERFPGSGRAEEVRLLLGILYARQLQRPQRAREVIEAAKIALHDPSQIALANELLGELPA